MLVVISDIHFVDGTAGEHNLPYSAFESVFLSDIASLAKDKKAKEIKILLLGDIMDVARSAKWFGLDPRDRPWGSNGLADVPIPRPGSITEKQTLKILGQASQRQLNHSKPPRSLDKNTILYKNWGTFQLFREFQNQLSEKFKVELPVEILYIPGNHDRLCNLYPSVRKELQKILGIKLSPNIIEGDITGEWRFRYDFKDEAYGVYARHGHQYDVWNCGAANDFTINGQLQVPIGEIFITEFGVKIPWILESMKNTYPEITHELIEKTKDIDNVRPLGRVMEWIYYRIKSEDSIQIRKALDEVFETVIKELLDNDFVKKWRSPATRLDEAIRALSSRWLSWIPKTLLDMIDAEDLLPLVTGLVGESQDPEKDIYLQAAYQERVWRENSDICFILYGHTHTPLQRPLDNERGREVIYLNTGTWRNRIYKTVELDKAPDFVELKQMTYSIFYRKDEDMNGKIPNTISFDIWTGSKKKHYA